MLPENMKYKLDAMNAMIQTLPQSTREIMNNADELIRRSVILATTYDELYSQVRDAGAYVKHPPDIIGIASAKALYLSKYDYDSPLVMSSVVIPGLFKNIPMSISLQLNGLFVIPNGEYLTVKYYHEKDNLPYDGPFWNNQIRENASNYKNEHCIFPHIISVSDINFEKEI